MIYSRVSRILLICLFFLGNTHIEAGFWQTIRDWFRSTFTFQKSPIPYKIPYAQRQEISLIATWMEKFPQRISTPKTKEQITEHRIDFLNNIDALIQDIENDASLSPSSKKNILHNLYARAHTALAQYMSRLSFFFDKDTIWNELNDISWDISLFKDLQRELQN